MDFKILSLNDKIEWNAYLSEIPYNDIYFSPEYLELASWNSEGQPFCAILKQKNLIVLYPFLLNSIKGNYKDIQSGYGYGGIISNTSSKRFIANFFNLFALWCEKENIIAEFIRFHPLLNNHLLSMEYADIQLNRKTVYLNLESNFESIWMQYDSKCRNIIRRANKEGFIVTSVELSNNNLKEFHDLYRQTMLNVGANDYYLFTQQYFIKMAELLSGKVALYNIYDGKKLIAASLFLRSSSIVNYHLSARDLKYRKYGLVNAILNEAIKDSIEKGYKTFHFGGGNSLIDSDSLFKFKKSFSKKTSDFYIGTKIHNKEQFDLFNAEWESANNNVEQDYSHIFLKYRM